MEDEDEDEDDDGIDARSGHRTQRRAEVWFDDLRDHAEIEFENKDERVRPHCVIASTSSVMMGVLSGPVLAVGFGRPLSAHSRHARTDVTARVHMTYDSMGQSVEVQKSSSTFGEAADSDAGATTG